MNKLFFVMFALSVGYARGAVYLRADSPGGADGSTFTGESWSTAYRTVAEAFSALYARSDTIADRTLYVAKGVYSTASVQASVGNTFASIAIYGGYKGETDGDMTRDVVEYQSIFTGKDNPSSIAWNRKTPILGGTTESSASAGCYVVQDGKVFLPAFNSDFDAFNAASVGAKDVMALKVDANGEGAVISGINFVCYGRGSPCTIQVVANAGAVTIEDCIFAGNQPQSGVVSFGSSSAASVVRRCTFFGSDQYATSATPLVTTGSVRVEDCLFAGNRKADGYGMSPLVKGDAEVVRCVFTHNFVINGSGNGVAPLVGSGAGRWTDCVITNNLAANHASSYQDNATIIGLSGRLERSLVANNRVEVRPIDGYDYFLAGMISANTASSYDHCLFASNTLVAVSTSVTSGGSYGLGILGGRGKWSTSGYSRNTLVNCTFDGNVVVPAEVTGVSVTLSRGVLVSDYNASTGSDAYALVTNCTFAGEYVAGVSDVAQRGISKKTSEVVNSVFVAGGTDVHANVFAVGENGRLSVRNCAIQNLVEVYRPERPDVTDGLTCDPYVFDRVPFTAGGVDTGWTVLRPAARLPGIRMTTDGSVRGAVNELAPVAESGATLTIRRDPFLGGSVSLPVQAVANGSAISPVTAVGSFAGWFEEGATTAYSTDNPLTISSLSEDLVLYARFGVEQVTVTFDLAGAGVFGDGQSVTNLLCDVGAAFPTIPDYLAAVDRHVYGWSELPSLVPEGGVTVRALSVSTELRTIAVHAGDDFAAAYRDAGRYRGELRVDGGTYVISEPLAMLPNVTVKGGVDGRETVLSGDTGSAFTYNAFISEADGVTNVAFYGLTFRDFARAAVELTGNAGDALVVSNCTFDTCNRSHQLALQAGCALGVKNRDLVCVDSRFTNNWRAVVAYFTEPSTSLYARCTFTGNINGSVFERSETSGLTIVTNCVFDANTGTTYDAGNSTWPCGTGFANYNVGARRLEIADCVFANARLEGNAQANLCLKGESEAYVGVTRCAFTNNVLSGAGDRSEQVPAVFLACKLKTLLFDGCLFSENRASASLQDAASSIALSEALSMSLNLCNCLFENNSARATKADRIAATIRNNNYSAMGLVHCSFVGNSVEAATEGCSAEIFNPDSWNTGIWCVNTILWNAADDYIPFPTIKTAHAAFAGCVIRNFDASICNDIRLFGTGVSSADPQFAAKDTVGPNGVRSRSLRTVTPARNIGFSRVWRHNGRLYAYSADLTTKTAKPWFPLDAKTGKETGSVEGLTLDDPLIPDAWDAPRVCGKVTPGAVNPPRLGLFLIVK